MPLIKKRKGKRKTASMEQLDSPKIKRTKPSMNVCSSPVTSSVPNELWLRRSGRKRTLKQFHDFEVELPQKEKFNRLDEQEETVDECENVEAEQEVKIEQASSEVEDDIGIYSKTKQIYKQACTYLKRKEIATKTMYGATSQKRKRNFVKVESKMNQNKQEFSYDLSLTLKRLGKIGGILYTCGTQSCEETFLSLKRLDLHKKLIHSEHVRHLCTHCNKHFGTFFMFRSHIRMEHSDLICLPYIIKNVDIVIKDKENKVGGKILVCTKCGYRYGQQENPDHVCQPMELRYYCPCCDFESFVDEEMQKHLSENHEGELQESKHIERYVELRSSAKEPGWSISPNDRTCEICDIKFESNAKLKLHLNNMHANHPFACGLCKICYGRKTALKKHMTTHRRTDLKCDVCKKEFYEKQRLAVHMLTHTGERPHQCEICGNRYCDERAVRKHILTKHTSPSDTSSAQTIKRGRSGIESASICHQCGKSFNNVALLNKHMKVHRKTKTYKCPDCDLAFNEISTLKQHKLSHKTLDFSQVGDKALTNESLNEIFKEIKVYEENHPSGKPYKCGICDKRFDKQQFVHRHIRVIHMKEEDKSFVCSICKRGFTLSAALRTHMRLHSNAKPYKCRLCDKQFRQVGHVKDHLLHHGKPQLQCKICKKMFKSRGSLRRHVRIHCKMHPFQCPIQDCIGAFQSLFPFLEHLSTCLVSVDVATLLECNFCQEKFSKNNITSHYHNHENDVRFPCEPCGMSFGNYQALYFHKEKTNHFLECEFEAPGNTNIVNRMKGPDAAIHWSNEELISLYDYIEEDAAVAANALRQENNDDAVYEEQSKINVNMDNDGELILIAEQLTYMASGFPYREVIVQTTENDCDGTITEITIEDMEDGHIVEQNSNGQSIEYAEQVAGEQNVRDNGGQSVFENQYHQVGGEQHFEEVHDGQSDEQVSVGQILKRIIAEQITNQGDVEQTKEQVVEEQNDETASGSQVVVVKKGNVKKPDQYNRSTFEDGSPTNLNDLQESTESTLELIEEEHKTQTPVKNKQLSEPNTTFAHTENVKSNLLPNNIDFIQEHPKDMLSKSNNVLQVDSVDTNKPDNINEKICPVCKCIFPDATALSEHYCVESSVSDLLSDTESEVETKNKIKRFKRRRRLTKRPKKFIMINSFSLLLREMYRKNAVEYVCTTGACGIIFNNINKLSHHKKQVHSENMKYMCSECQKQFGSFYVYKSHIRMEHSTRISVRFQLKGTNIKVKSEKDTLVREILVCTKCGYRYGGQDDFKHDCGPRELLYYCPCCTYASEDVSLIGEHISDMHPGNFKSVELTDRYAHLRSANREPGMHISHRAKTCDDCNITFNSNEELKQHLNTKHAAHPFACGICKTCYGRKSALQKHMLSHRNLDLKCNVCQKEFSYKSRLDIHKMIHTGNKPHCCEVCGNRYCDEKSLQKHMMIKHIEEFKKKYPNKALKANVSKKIVTKTPSMCHYCGKSFSTNIQLKRHFREHKKEEMFKCPHCQLTFEDIVVFKKHKSTHQTLEFSGTGNLKNMSTADMNAIFKEIKVHEDGHPSGKPYKCGICDKRFDKQQFVHRHIRVIHMKEEDKSFVCSICKRGFTLSAALRTHMRLHSNAKPYKCRLCDKQFRQVGHVKDHLLHHGKPQLQCKICKKMFKSKGNLRRHVQIHCKILPFQCPVNKCTAAFHSLYSFLAHCTECFKSVGSNATLKCNFCSEAFSANEILTHYHSHENDLDFPCQTCGISFVTYQRLYFHKEEKQHFVESEFETPNHNVETRLDTQTADEDTKPSLSQEELLQQYDYIQEEDCSIPNLDSTETEGMDTAALQEEALDNLPVDVQVEHEVADIIVNQLNQEEIILTADQLSELTSGVVYQEVVVEEDQTGVVNEGAVMVDNGDVLDIGTSQHFINSEGTRSEVFTVTDPATEEVTYYIIPLDQTAS